MRKRMHRAVLPSVQHWLRSHTIVAVYLLAAMIAWGIFVGVRH